ncbi:DUF397 domain-containing protein [Streptomyces olivoreticuli]
MSTERIWFKSSYSGTAGGDCIEVAYRWHKSSYSGGAGGNCVEIAAQPPTIHVRDSKHRSGPQLSIPRTAWADFITYCR